MLEEAPKETILEVEDGQREARHESVEAEAETGDSGPGPVARLAARVAVAGVGAVGRRWGQQAANNRAQPTNGATSGAIPTTGALSGFPPMDPRNGAVPKANTPPSAAASQ